MLTKLILAIFLSISFDVKLGLHTSRMLSRVDLPSLGKAEGHFLREMSSREGKKERFFIRVFLNKKGGKKIHSGTQRDIVYDFYFRQ